MWRDLFLATSTVHRPPPLQWHHWPAAHKGRCCICHTPPSLQTPAALSRHTQSRRRHSREGCRLAPQGWTTGWWLQGGAQVRHVLRHFIQPHTARPILWPLSLPWLGSAASIMWSRDVWRSIMVDVLISYRHHARGEKRRLSDILSFLMLTLRV